MSLRSRLRSALLGGGASFAAWTYVSRDMWRAQNDLAYQIELRGLALPRATPSVQQLPSHVTQPLPQVDEPDWSAETKVETVRKWNEKVRTWHKVVSDKIFQ